MNCWVWRNQLSINETSVLFVQDVIMLFYNSSLSWPHSNALLYIVDRDRFSVLTAEHQAKKADQLRSKSLNTFAILPSTLQLRIRSPRGSEYQTQRVVTQQLISNYAWVGTAASIFAVRWSLCSTFVNSFQELLQFSNKNTLWKCAVMALTCLSESTEVLAVEITTMKGNTKFSILNLGVRCF